MQSSRDAARDAQWKEEVRKRQQRHLPSLKDEKHQKLFFFTSYTSAPEPSGGESQIHQTHRHRHRRRSPQAPEAGPEESQRASDAQRRPQPQEPPPRIDHPRGRSSSAEVMAVSTTPRPWAFKDESLDQHQAKALARYTRRLHSGRPGRIA